MLKIYKVDGINHLVLKQDRPGEAFIASPTSLVISIETFYEILRFLDKNNVLSLNIKITEKTK